MPMCYKDMTFEGWLNEIENLSTRIERLEEDVDFAAVMMGIMSHNLARRRMYDWLEAAYKVGYEAGATEGIGSGKLMSLEEPEGGK